MQNSAYVALPIVCQRIYSDVLWHFTTVQTEPETAHPHPWLSRPWLLSYPCYDIHMEGSALLFLTFVWALLPSFCLHSSRDSKPCAGLNIYGKVGSRGLTRHRGHSWPLCLQSHSLSEEDNPPHIMCVVRKPGGPSTSYVELSTRLLSVRAGLEDSLSFVVLSSPLYAPIAAGLQLIPGCAGKAHCSS